MKILNKMKKTALLIMILILVWNLDSMAKGMEDLASLGDISTLAANEKKNDTIYVQTSAICDMCKERLEHDMAFEKGVKAVDLDLDTKKLMIVYREDKNTPEELKKAITLIGYDADEMVADQKAHDRLPACCQKGTEPH